MYSNAVELASFRDDTTRLTLTLVDTDNGTSVRRLFGESGGSHELRIAHQKANDNGAQVPTVRHLVRLDKTVYVTTLPKPQEVKMSAYVVLVVPAIGFGSNPKVEAAELLGLLMSLFNLDVTYVQPTDIPQVPDLELNVQRLLTGEV